LGASEADTGLQFERAWGLMSLQAGAVEIERLLVGRVPRYGSFGSVV